MNIEPSNYYCDGDRDPYLCEECDAPMYEVSHNEIYCTTESCTQFNVHLYREVYDG